MSDKMTLHKTYVFTMSLVNKYEHTLVYWNRLIDKEKEGASQVVESE